MAGKLPPSERMKNYADAVMKVWPVILVLIGGLGYTNKDEIKGMFFAEADGKTEVENWKTMIKFSHEMREEIERIDGELAVLKAETAEQDANNYGSLARKIKATGDRDWET